MALTNSSGNIDGSNALFHTQDDVTLGELLAEARKRRGLTLEQVSHETKIPQRHLEALEQDKLGVVPDPFYRRAEIRSFAHVVHLDEHLALARLGREMRASVVRGATPAVSRSLRRSAIPLLLGFGASIAAAILWSAISRRAPAAYDDGSLSQMVTSAVDKTAIEGVVATQSDQVSPSPEPRPSAGGPSTRGLAATTGSNAPQRSGNVIIERAAVPEDQLTQLVVTTEPPGARVTVNGIGWGTAPVVIANIPAGTKRIRVTKEGFATKEQMVRLRPGRQRRLDIRLRTVGQQ